MFCAPLSLFCEGVMHSHTFRICSVCDSHCVFNDLFCVPICSEQPSRNYVKKLYVPKRPACNSYASSSVLYIPIFHATVSEIRTRIPKGAFS